MSVRDKSSIKNIQSTNITTHLAYFDSLLLAPKSTGVPPYHEKYIKPLTEQSNSKSNK